MRFLIATLLIAMASAASAKDIVYDCRITKKNHGLVPDQLVIARDAASKRVVVNDPLIHYFNKKKPLDAKISGENNKRFSVKWKIPKVKMPNGTFIVRLEYRATVIKADNKINVTVRAAGYEGHLFGQGACRIL